MMTKMANVSISEAARLTGKNRRTIQRHIDSGKLSKVTDPATGVKTVDTSELYRVYGKLNITSTTATISQTTTPQTTVDLQIENTRLKLELEHARAMIEEKEKRNDDLKQALLMLENKAPEKPNKKWFFFGKK